VSIVPPNDTDHLLRESHAGDPRATEQLLDRYRVRLKTMVACRMDPELAQRLDSSDVVQDALIVAHRRLPQYLEAPQVAFYPWLRRIALNRLIDLQRRHLKSQRRSAYRELPLGKNVSDQSAVILADRLVSFETSPLTRLTRAELVRRMQLALELLSERHRENSSPCVMRLRCWRYPKERSRRDNCGL
jgi:RNA polymerase sigma-70 factor, ECF subfamily